jgi:hypothetical protein
MRSAEHFTKVGVNQFYHGWSKPVYFLSTASVLRVEKLLLLLRRFTSPIAPKFIFKALRISSGVC